MAISLVTIDQYVTTNITPFLVLCLGLAVIFLLRPSSTLIVFGVVLTAYLLLIGTVQKEPAILLTNRVNGITFVVFGMYLRLFCGTRKNLFQAGDQKTAERTRRKNAELQRLAFLDTLTGLYNRRKWYEFAEEESLSICRYSTSSAGSSRTRSLQNQRRLRPSDRDKLQGNRRPVEAQTAPSITLSLGRRRVYRFASQHICRRG